MDWLLIWDFSNLSMCQRYVLLTDPGFVRLYRNTYNTYKAYWKVVKRWWSYDVISPGYIFTIKTRLFIVAVDLKGNLFVVNMSKKMCCYKKCATSLMMCIQDD